MGLLKNFFVRFIPRRPVNPEICITFLLRWLALAYISSAACIYFPPDWTKPLQRETVSSMARILFQFYRGQCYLKVILNFFLQCNNNISKDYIVYFSNFIEYILLFVYIKITSFLKYKGYKVKTCLLCIHF